MSMLKRNAAVVVLAGLVLGGAAVAWAGGGPARPTVLAAAQTDQSAPPPSTPATPATPATPPAPLTDAERQAKREALKACLEAAGEDAAARQACMPAGMPGPAHKGPGGPGHPGPLGGLPLLGRAVHGDVVVPGPTEGAWQTVTFDRGKVDEATDASKIVLDRPDGATVTIALTADTKYHMIADAGAIREGEPAMVVSKDGKALQVVQPDPRHRKGPGPGPGGPPPEAVPGNNGDAPVVPND
jgi:hypothetical protein